MQTARTPDSLIAPFAQNKRINLVRWMSEFCLFARVIHERKGLQKAKHAGLF